MANTYSSLFYHFVFSTKNRNNWIKQDIETRVWEFLGGIARKHGVTTLQVGGIEDHIHLLIMSKPKFSPSKIAQFVKGESSRWIHEEFAGMHLFSWQDGYSVFSVSRSGVPKVIDYIKNQRQKHEGKSFEDEYVDLLRLHEIDVVDERFIFG